MGLFDDLSKLIDGGDSIFENSSSTVDSADTNSGDFSAFDKMFEQSVQTENTNGGTTYNSSFTIRSKEDIEPFVYIVSSRIGFRPDAYSNALKRAGHLVEEIRLKEDSVLPTIVNPKCFIMDIGDEVITNLDAQQAYLYIEEKATEYRVPIFAIGQPENLNILCATLKDYTIVTKFERPVDVNSCIEHIKKVLENNAHITLRKHLLAVDDSIVTLKLLKTVFEKEYRLTVANSATECVKLLGTFIPDMIILDIDMPVCSGEQLLKMIREIDSHIPIVVYTGKSDVDVMIALMQEGIDGYLLKTQKPIELLNYINEFFKKKDEDNSDEGINLNGLFTI